MNLKNLLRASGDLPGAAVAHRAALALPPRAGRSTTTWHVLWRRPATRRPKSTFNLLSIFRHKRRPSITGLRMRPPLGAILRSHSSSTNPHWRWSRNAAGHRLHWAERRCAWDNASKRCENSPASPPRSAPTSNCSPNSPTCNGTSSSVKNRSLCSAVLSNWHRKTRMRLSI